MGGAKAHIQVAARYLGHAELATAQPRLSFVKYRRKGQNYIVA